jgi:hypothetical protein
MPLDIARFAEARDSTHFSHLPPLAFRPAFLLAPVLFLPYTLPIKKQPFIKKYWKSIGSFNGLDF